MLTNDRIEEETFTSSKTGDDILTGTKNRTMGDKIRLLVQVL